MNINKIRKIIYLNIVVLIAFLFAITLTLIILLKKDINEISLEQVIVVSICAPIIVGSMGFWTWELKHLFTNKGEK